ncbi:Hypothetical predicted protein, partial [Paramuricea clavata]
LRRGQNLAERDELTSGPRRNLPTYHEAVDDFRREDVPPVGNDHRVDTRREREPERGERPSQVRSTSPEQDYEELWHAKSGAKTHALTPQMLESCDTGHFNNIAETLDPTFQRATRRANEEAGGEQDERASGGKSAPIVPPLKRKISRDKNKKSRGEINVTNNNCEMEMSIFIN